MNLADILMNKMKVKQRRHISQFHSLFSDMRGFFAEMDTSFQILGDWVCVIHNVMITDTPNFSLHY